MTAVFVSMVVCVGAGLTVASSLVRYAQRHWKGYQRETGGSKLA